MGHRTVGHRSSTVKQAPSNAACTPSSPDYMAGRGKGRQSPWRNRCRPRSAPARRRGCPPARAARHAGWLGPSLIRPYDELPFVGQTFEVVRTPGSPETSKVFAAIAQRRRAHRPSCATRLLSKHGEVSGFPRRPTPPTGISGPSAQEGTALRHSGPRPAVDYGLGERFKAE